MEQTPYVKTEINQGIGSIEFFHPKGNSFPSFQLQKLIDALHQLDENEEVKVIILKSFGEKVFCAGASFDELTEIDSVEKSNNFFLGFARVLITIRECEKFIIAQVEGKVVGGGVGIAAACDYVYALENASIRLSELSIGFGPFVIEPAIRRKMGLNALSALTLQPKEWKSAHWAKEKGLFNEVYASPQKLTDKVQAFASELTAYSPEAMRLLRKIFWEGTENWAAIMPQRAAMSGELALTATAQNAIQNAKNRLKK